MTGTIDSKQFSALSLLDKKFCLRALRAVATLACVATYFTATQLAQAAPINYGSFTGATVTYVDVTEDANSAGDAPPLFGAPYVSSSADSISFNPVGFNASASGAAGSDQTDGNLSFMIVSKPTYAVKNISLSEGGETTLLGFGTDATFTSVTANVFVTVNEVDGAGIVFGPAEALNLAFTPSGGTFGLLTDGGGGPLYNKAFGGSLFVNINQILTNRGIPFSLGATKVTFNVDNTLSALSQAGTFALIAKKQFGGVSITVNVPEPTALALFGIGALVVAGRRRVR
jgi:hypothetical protein